MIPRRAAAAAGVAAITAAAMVATPLARQGGATRRVLSSAVIGGLAATTTTRVAARWGATRAATALAGVIGAAAAVEFTGSRTGVPFGRYRYTGALQPELGGVPVVVPFAWFAMAVPAREVAHATLGTSSTPVRRVVLGSVALTAWDLFLDPQMVGEGYWTWQRNGRYRGIPLSNFAGWLVTSAGVMALLELLLPPVAGSADAPLTGEYAFVAVMETIGFAAFFRDRTVALTGGAATLPLVLAAGSRLLGARR